MILNEISRIKKIMGLNTNNNFINESYKKNNILRLISEGITGNDELFKMLGKAAGLSDEMATTFSKEAGSFMKQSDEFAQVLSREGLDDVGKIQQKLFNSGYDVSNLDSALTMYLKQNPDLSKQILKSIPEFTDNIVKNMSLETLFAKRPDLVAPLKSVSSPDFKLKTQDMIDDYKSLMGEISKLFGESGGNQSLGKILDLMELKVKSTELSNSLGTSSVSKQSTPIKTDSNATPKNDVSGSNGPQSYLNKYSQEELERIHGFYDWKPFGKTLNMMSGWKFHVFGEDLKDAIYLESVLKPIVDRWGAEAKVGGINHTSGMYDSMKPGGIQYGKQGATIYIPVDVINSGRQKEMLADIQNALTGYNKGGNISGDQAITPSIHYRYEYVGPVPKEGLPRENVRAMYNKNDGGPYKPDDVEDLFGGSVNKQVSNTSSSADIYKTNRELYDIYLEDGNTTAMYDWLKTLPRDEMEDLYKYINEKKLTGNQNKQNNVRPKEGPSNWSDYQDPNRGNNPYYGTGSN